MKTMPNTPASSVLNRRSFVAKGAAALALPGLLHAQSAAPAKKMRIGIAGGRFGATFQWHLHPDCVVAAVTDLHEDRRNHLKKLNRCDKAYPSLEEMVKDPDLDAIAVFTDGTLHFQHAILCLEHGKHVISAVPAVMAHTVAEGLDQAHRLFEKVNSTGLTYMMAETSYWQQRTISVRKMYQAGELGEIVSCDSDYLHPGISVLAGTAEKPTWRYGAVPMFYPTHCTAHLISITHERLTEVSCNGWGNEHPILKKNAFANNPFWNETAHFRTDKGNPFRVRIWWDGPFWNTESASWYGTKMSLPATGEKWSPSTEVGKDDAGFAHVEAKKSAFDITEWWKTDMLPEPLRVRSGHDGSHPFITHEFIDALKHNRRPAVDISEALAYTVPGIIAHQSAIKDGESLKIPQIG